MRPGDVLDTTPCSESPESVSAPTLSGWARPEAEVSSLLQMALPCQIFTRKFNEKSVPFLDFNAKKEYSHVTGHLPPPPTLDSVREDRLWGCGWGQEVLTFPEDEKKKRVQAFLFVFCFSLELPKELHPDICSSGEAHICTSRSWVAGWKKTPQCCFSGSHSPHPWQWKWPPQILPGASRLSQVGDSERGTRPGPHLKARGALAAGMRDRGVLYTPTHTCLIRKSHSLE